MKMGEGKERSAHEQETLIFKDEKEASRFTERVRERWKKEKQPGVDQRRDIVGEEVAKEFERVGVGVEVIKHPWEHTRQEHEEVQRLVDVAFDRDLPVAVREARAGEHYPRNADLLHDVLTTEMYELLRERKLDRQPLFLWLLLVAGIVVVAIFAVILLWLS